MGNLKKLLGESVIYGVSSIIGRFLNYLLVPLYTYKIAASSGGYGLVTNIYAYTALLLVLLTFGMETTFFYFANRQQDKDPGRIFSTALGSVGCVALLFVLLCFGFTGSIASALHYETHPEFIRIMAAVVGLDAFQAILFAKLRFEHKAWKFALLKLAFIVGNIGLNLFIFLLAPALSASHPAWMAWYRPDYQVGYIFVVNLICTASVTFGFLPELKSLRHGIDFPLLKQMLKYTWPLLLMGIIGILNQVADKICYRFLVPGAEGDVQLGIYGACVKIAMIMAMITQAFRYAYEPFVFGEKKGKQSKDDQAAVMKYFVMFTLFAFLVVVLYLDILKYIIKRDYWDGLRAVPVVMIAEIFMGIYFNLSFWYKQTEKTWWGAIFSGLGCIVLLAINFLFVPKYGYMACAWGGLAGYGVCMLLSFVAGLLLQNKEPYKAYIVRYPLKSIFAYFTLAMLLYGLSTWLHPQGTGLTLAFNTLLLLVYMTAICYGERELLKRLLHRRKN
ncbi:MAG: lipopolysaccharide biosynthesis protein [Bacteroidales bacterium]|nr:lipopolysaccharide biosynthesis protein [Bacteroidales bacterium]